MNPFSLAPEISEELKNLKALREEYVKNVTAYNSVLFGLPQETQDALFRPVMTMLVTYGRLTKAEEIYDQSQKDG